MERFVGDLRHFIITLDGIMENGRETSAHVVVTRSFHVHMFAGFASVKGRTLCLKSVE